MTSTVMTIKTDKKIKEQAQKLAKKMGFPLGTLVNAFLRQLICDKMVNFSVEPTIVMNKRLEKKLASIEADIKKEKNISKGFESAKEMIDYLDNAKI